MKKVLALVLFAFLSCDLLIAQSLHWHPSQGTSSDNMGCVFVIYINDELEVNDQLELGVFNGETCKGNALMSTNFLGLNVWDVTVFGDTGDQFTFRLFDHSLGQELEYLTCAESVTYAQLGYGNHMEPYPLHFTGSQSTTFDLPITGYGTNPEPGNYKLISSPIGAVRTSDVENLMSNNYDLYYFDQAGDDPGNEPNNEWINMHDGGTLQVGKGYLYANSENVTLHFTGTPYTGEATFPLDYSTANQSENMRGWNLVGNPFGTTATINFDEFYVMRNDGANLIEGSGEIDIMQGVFVKATGTGQSVTFTPGTSNGEVARVVLNVLKDRGNTIDRAVVRLNGHSTLPKFMLNPQDTKIYIPQDGDDYAVVSSTANELPISFKAASNGTYTLNVAVENTEMHYLHLIDNIAGTDVNLLDNPSYTFEANTGDHANRFTLVMSSTVGVEEHFAFYNGHNWTVSNPSTGSGPATLQVIDMTGRVVSTKTIDGTSQLDVNAAPGVYMFRLVNGNDVKVQKVVVR